MAANYGSKAKESFKTCLRFFKFHCILNDVNFTEEEFLNFRLDLNFTNQVTSQYYQWLPTDNLEGFQKELTVGKLFASPSGYPDIKADGWFDSYFEKFREQFPIAEFERIANSNTCEYCGITLDDIEKLAGAQQIHKKCERGYCMEIDRKHANLEYTTDNCVSSCYWCNNAKTDEFTAEEFKPIGQLIGKTLKARLNK